MTDLDNLLKETEEIYRDLKFSRVRDWKEKTGGLAIGYMPIYVPRELLHSLGVLPVGLMGGGEDLEIIRGDAFYQSYICHIPRSTIELGLNGSLDDLDGILFPAICDVIRNLSGMWKLQFPEKLVRYLDVPQNFDADIGGQFYRLELESLIEDLVRRGASAYDPDRLRASIEVFNENRRLVAELHDLRAKEPWKIPTWELYVLLRASLIVDVSVSTEWLRRYRVAVEQADRRPRDQARVLLTGSFCEQPPLGLIKTLEKSGCYIVDDDLVQVHRWIEGEISTSGDPLQNLVQAFLDQSVASPVRYIAEDKKGADLIDRVNRSGAEGVLFCAPSFCDPALLDQPMTSRAIEEAGIPWTAFKYAENNGQFQVIREQAGTFSDSIKLWGTDA